MSSPELEARYCIATGNAFDGMAMIGPFDSFDAAHSYAESYCDNGADWRIVELHRPETDSSCPVCNSTATMLDDDGAPVCEGCGRML